MTQEQQATQGLSDEDRQAIANFNKSAHDTALLNQIVGEMKIIRELPSEAPTERHELTHVEFPPAGGVLTYMSGYDQPYRGFPFAEFVEKIDVVKKIQRNILSSLYHALKRRKILVLGLAFAPWILGDIVNACLYAFYRMVDRFKIKPERYSDPIRELYRAFSYEKPSETILENKERLMLRDLLCMFLEFDNAYRFRFQDIVVELDKVALKSNPKQEIVRLFTVMAQREKTPEVRDTWTLATTFLPWYMRFNKTFREAIVRVLADLDLSKLALTVEDKEFATPREDYVFGFMSDSSEEATIYREISSLVQEHKGKVGRIKDDVTKKVQSITERQQTEVQGLQLSPNVTQEALIELQQRHLQERLIEDTRNNALLQDEDTKYQAHKKELKAKLCQH